MLAREEKSLPQVHVVPTDLEMDDQSKITNLLDELARKGSPVDPIAFLAFADISAVQQIRIQEYVNVAIAEINRRFAREGEPAPEFTEVIVFRGNSTNKFLLEAGKELSPQKKAEIHALRLRWARDPQAAEFQPQVAAFQAFLERHKDRALHVTQIAQVTGSALAARPAPGQEASMDIYAGFNIRSVLEEYEKAEGKAKMVEGFEKYQDYVALKNVEYALSTEGTILNRRIDILKGSVDEADVQLRGQLQAQLQELKTVESALSKSAKTQKTALEKEMDQATPETIQNLITVYGIAAAFNYFKKQSETYTKKPELVKSPSFDANFTQVIWAYKKMLEPKELELAAHFRQFPVLELASNMALGKHRSVESALQPLYFAAMRKALLHKGGNAMIEMHRRTGSAWNDNDIREILFNRSVPDVADIQADEEKDYVETVDTVVDREKGKFYKDAKAAEVKLAFLALNRAIFALRKEPMMTEANTRQVHEAVLAVAEAYKNSNPPQEMPWQFNEAKGGKYLSQTKDPEWQRVKADDLLGYARRHPENMEVTTYAEPYGIDSRFNINPDLSNPNKFYKDRIDAQIVALRKAGKLETPEYGPMTFTGKIKNMVLFEVHSILDFVGTSPRELLALLESMSQQYDAANPDVVAAKGYLQGLIAAQPLVLEQEYDLKQSRDVVVAPIVAQLELALGEEYVLEQAPRRFPGISLEELDLLLEEARQLSEAKQLSLATAASDEAAQVAYTEKLSKLTEARDAVLEMISKGNYQAEEDVHPALLKRLRELNGAISALEGDSAPQQAPLEAKGEEEAAAVQKPRASSFSEAAARLGALPAPVAPSVSAPSVAPQELQKSDSQPSI